MVYPFLFCVCVNIIYELENRIKLTTTETREDYVLSSFDQYSPTSTRTVVLPIVALGAHCPPPPQAGAV